MAQDCSNSSALTLELLQSSTKASRWWPIVVSEEKEAEARAAEAKKEAERKAEEARLEALRKAEEAKKEEEKKAAEAALWDETKSPEGWVYYWHTVTGGRVERDEI